MTYAATPTKKYHYDHRKTEISKAQVATSKFIFLRVKNSLKSPSKEILLKISKIFFLKNLKFTMAYFSLNFFSKAEFISFVVNEWHVAVTFLAIG